MVKITMSKKEYDLLLSIVLECKAHTERLAKEGYSPITRELAEMHIETIELVYGSLIYNREDID